MSPDEIERAHPALQPHLRQLAVFQYLIGWYAQRAEQIVEEYCAAHGLSLPERPRLDRPPVPDLHPPTR